MCHDALICLENLLLYYFLRSHSSAGGEALARPRLET